MKTNHLFKKLSVSIASLALICPLTLSSITNINVNASSNESKIINYNAHNGSGQGSAFHTPTANNPKDVHITNKDSMGFNFTIPGGTDDYRTERRSPLWNQIMNKRENKVVHSHKNIHRNIRKGKKYSKRSLENLINKISWKQVNNTKWIYNALHKRSIYNYLKYNDKNKEDRQQIKQAYKDVKDKRVSKARKVYKMMWIKDYDFLHHGESFKNTKNAMNSFDRKKVNYHNQKNNLSNQIKQGQYGKLVRYLGYHNDKQDYQLGLKNKFYRNILLDITSSNEGVNYLQGALDERDNKLSLSKFKSAKYQLGYLRHGAINTVSQRDGKSNHIIKDEYKYMNNVYKAGKYHGKSNYKNIKTVAEWKMIPSVTQIVK